MRSYRPYAVAIAVSLVAGACALARVGSVEPDLPPGGTGWRLAFTDDFDGVALDGSKWTTCYWWADGGCTNGSSGEVQWYMPGRVSVTGGSLRLEAGEQAALTPNGDTYEFTSGMVSTGPSTDEPQDRPRFAFQYGFVEMRARVPAGQGLWSAFWLLPTSLESRPEIDVAEVLGHEPQRGYAYVHLADDGHKIDDGDDWVTDDMSVGWHRFGLWWTPETLTWYVDDVASWRYTDAARTPSEPMYVLANLAVGGEWAGPPDATTRFPSTLEIDHVRVWQQRSDGGE
ncbi:MAG: glycoside hydrolase family 16 protein [Acidimicrobiales bacterium]